MIVEFIGCTGAGKSTLVAQLRQELSQQAHVVSSFEVVAARLGLSHIAQPTVQNLIQEVAGLPFFLGSLPSQQRFLRFTLQMMARQGNFNFYSFNHLRSLERTIGVDGFIRSVGGRQAAQPQIVFVDEGTIVPAHNIFVYNDVAYSAQEINRYAELAPLPDVIVYVRAPIEQLIKRTQQRPDPPREMRGQSAARIEYFIRRADAMFEQLVSNPRLQQRLLLVDAPEKGDALYGATVQQLAQQLLKSAVSATGTQGSTAETNRNSVHARKN
jgi:thymidylate kinase